MAERDTLENFIPIRCGDLVELLANESGPRVTQKLTFQEQEEFRRLARIMMAYYHKQYHDQLLTLKDEYNPFDPDSDTREIFEVTEDERELMKDHTFDDFVLLLDKANYHHHTREELETNMVGASYWGIDMKVDWTCFERVEVFSRGNVIGQRRKRHPIWFWKVSNVPVRTYQRLAVVLKQNNHKKLGPDPDTKHIFLKLFKDIPQMDLEMVLPGTRLKMPTLDRWKLGLTIAFSVGYLAWQFYTKNTFDALAQAVKTGTIITALMAIYGPLALVLGYGYKTYAGFQATRQTYMYMLAQSLYYQNLDNNAGVLYRLLDEAEDQESREAILAYFFLWRYAGETGWTATELDDYIELELEKRLNLELDFEIKDALTKLTKMQLLQEMNGDRYRVIPITQAVEILGAELNRMALQPLEI